MERSSHAKALLTVLRRQLRQQGWTTARIAEELNVGPATAQRWLANRGLTLDKLETLAGLCGLSLADLTRMSEKPPPELRQELTPAQERALSKDVFLGFLFVALLSGEDWRGIGEDLDISPRAIEAGLQRLERLALIDRLPGGRVRPTIDRHLVWRRPHMRALFERRMKPQFMSMDFSAEDAVYATETIKLSAVGAAQLAELIEKFRREVQDLAARDRETAVLPRKWHGVLCALRPLSWTGALAAAATMNVKEPEPQE
jgi:transcriptional regulator with XRE-family HTH domain